MARQPGLFDVDERLRRLSDIGDQLEAFAAVVDFEMFRPDLVAALNYSDGAKGGRPPFDAVMMFKILVIQAQNNLSDDRAEFLINDRLSFMRFLGLGLGDRVPDAKTIWAFRRGLLDPTNTGTTVWADSAYRSQANEAFMERHGFRPSRRKRRISPMPISASGRTARNPPAATGQRARPSTARASSPSARWSRWARSRNSRRRRRIPANSARSRAEGERRCTAGRSSLRVPAVPWPPDPPSRQHPRRMEAWTRGSRPMRRA
jgi:hypothetical protein